MNKENERSVPRGVHVYALVVAVATFLLVIVGGLVTSTGSGLSVPDWPLSYGKVLPPMEGGVLYEHGHRMVAAAVGLMTIILMVLLLRHSRRASIRGLGIAAAVAVVLQGLLGGLTVLMELPTAISVAHGSLGQIFFALVVAIALFTAPGWLRRREGEKIEGRWVSVLLLVVVFIQLIIGAWMRHAGAGVAIPDFPLALGRVIPPLDSFPVTIHFVHRLGALAVAVTAVITAVVFLRNPKVPSSVKSAAGGLLGLVVVQIILGGAVVLNLRPVGITTAHVAVGSLILALSAVLWLVSYRARVSLAPVRESAPSHDLVGDLAKGSATS
jgi:cytochrome c oxidase assembly protein subunit 15